LLRKPISPEPFSLEAFLPPRPAACSWPAAPAASFAQTAAPTAPRPLAESVPSDLRASRRPLHYRIEVAPTRRSWTFTGTSTIDVEVFRSTDSLTLHANELEFSLRACCRRRRGDGCALSRSRSTARRRLCG
jgi:hypothetical protein